MFLFSSFLDKMYSLSSAEALVQFTRNPRAYLLPPQPRIPCKVCVVGPPTSGKTSLARAVAEKYNATVSKRSLPEAVASRQCLGIQRTIGTLIATLVIKGVAMYMYRGRDHMCINNA